MFVVPLHRLAEESGADWAGSAEFTRGVPDDVPPVQPLPPIAQVLDAFRRALDFGRAPFPAWTRVHPPPETAERDDHKRG